MRLEKAASGLRLQRILDTVVAAGAPAALAQFSDESGIWSGSSGVAELGGQQPPSANGYFRIGSVTKTFTATVLLQLVGEDVVRLDDTVGRWLPGLVPGGDKITLRQLLNHTSGLYNYTEDLPDNAGILRDRSQHWNPQQAVALATRHDPLFEPGTTRSYSNTNYILLGMVIERATGRPYDAEIEHRILRPLDLRQTLIPGDNEALPQPHAHGYLAIDGQPIDITAFNASQAWAAGEIVSTAEDLNRFYKALLTGVLLRSAKLATMQTTLPTDIPEVDGGMGIARVRLPDGTAVWGHTGTIFGYHTVSYHCSDAARQLTMSVTTAGDRLPVTRDLLIGVFCG